MSKHAIFRAALPRILIALCLLELITGCNSLIGHNAPISPTVFRSTQNSSLPTPNIEKTRALDLAGLLHLEFNPIRCMTGIDSNVIVLASNRLEYDNGEIQQMDTYVSQIIKRGVLEAFGNFYYDDPPVPPATLNETSGAFLGSSTELSDTTCSGDLQITNIGKSTLQITGVNVRLLSDAQLNQYHYRLIDYCSLPTHMYCPTGGGGGVEYDYFFNLSKAKADTIFSGELQENHPLLEPGQVTFISLHFHSSENLIYSVAPEFTVVLVDEKRTFTLSQWTSTLAFARPSQFSCYQLHSNTFTQTALSTSKGWCI